MASLPPVPTRIRFDAFELDARSGELRKSGILLRLQPQPFRLLFLLIDHAGQVVTREEIQRSLWADSTFVDFDHGINYSINQIRSALADDAEKPRYIETLPKRGYRFIGNVEQPPTIPKPAEMAGSEAMGNITVLKPAPEAAPQTHVVRFGDFELDLRAGELRKEGVRIKLQEQPFQVLAMLLEHFNQVVTREEIQNKLWPTYTFVDFDHSLNRAINNLREALGDSADQPRFIETLAKRGYRFIAPIESTPARLKDNEDAIDSIAVFPLDNESSDPDTEYLAVGIPGSIIHSLSQIPKLRVVSWRSTNNQDNRLNRPLAIGRKLGVKAVLIGRIWQRSNKLRLHVDLLDTATGDEIWGEQYDRGLTELFAIQDDIAREISIKLQIKMTGEAEARITKRYTENVEAYHLYVRARRCAQKRSIDGFKRGTDYLMQAIQIDPNYALAYAELAQCVSVPCYYGAVDPNIAYPRARTYALRALEIDPNLAEAHEVVATVLKNYDWNWGEAEKKYKYAIRLNPNYTAARYHYSILLAEQGRFDEAIHEATEALSREPMSALLNAGLAYVLLQARKLTQCIEQALTAAEVAPDLILCCWLLGTAYEYQGKYREARETYEKCIALGAPVAFPKAFLAHLGARTGERQKAWDTLHELQELSHHSYVPQLASAIVYDGLHETDRGIEALDRAYQARETVLVVIKGWPHFDNLRHDPRFQEIARRVGLIT